MSVLIFQTVAAAVAGYALFVAWRRLRDGSQTVAFLVAIGLIIRSLAGQAAFWISYLNLDFARSLQLGGGFWFFGLDGTGYYRRATAAAAAGLPGILNVSRADASPAYVQLLASGVMLFGASPAVAILLNVAAYVATCVLLVRIGRSNEFVTSAAVAAITFSPSLVLWSLQPLKDVVFVLVVLVCIASGRLWLREVTDKTPRPHVQALLAITLVACFFILAGIRWYVGPLMLVAFLPLFVTAVWRARRRFVATAISVVLLAILGVAVETGAGPFLPEPMRVLKRKSPLAGSVGRMVDTIVIARSGSERTGGATLIGSGSQPAPEPAAKQTAPAPPVLSAAQPAAAGQRETVPAKGATTKAPAAAMPATPLASPPSPSSPRPAPASETRTDIREPEHVQVAASTTQRFLTGGVALMLPRFIAQPLGLIKVGGGRGLMWFVDLDTLLFDLMLVAVVLTLWKQRRRLVRAPVMWLLLIYASCIAALLAYTVTNYGSLFRQRSMVYIALVAIPVFAADATVFGRNPALPEDERGT